MKKKIYGPICNELSKCIKSILLSQKEKKKKVNPSQKNLLRGHACY